MSEETKVVDFNEAPPIKFDPTKQYTWPADAQISISGAEFGSILNALRGVVTTPEAQAIFLAADATERVERILARSVENGTFVELKSTTNNS